MIQMKKIDYTNSAVNLCNPPELKSLLTNLARLKQRETACREALQKTALYTQFAISQNDTKECEDALKAAIEAHGSYQDLNAGDYAIKQKKLSVTYIASKVREFLRTYADAVIEEVVSKPKLEGLRKGGLVSQADLDRCADTTESFAYIIKVPEGG